MTHQDEIDALSILAQTISAITRDGPSGWSWESFEVDHSDVSDGHLMIRFHMWRTDSQGHGLWRWEPTGTEWVDHDGRTIQHDYAWNQVLGSTQLDLNCSPGTRHERVLHAMGFQWEPSDPLSSEHRMTARQMYARTPRIPMRLCIPRGT